MKRIQEEEDIKRKEEAEQKQKEEAEEQARAFAKEQAERQEQAKPLRVILTSLYCNIPFQ